MSLEYRVIEIYAREGQRWMVSHRTGDLSGELPIKLEIVLPAAEVEEVLPVLEEMVHDGLMVVRGAPVALHRSSRRLLPRGMRVRNAMSSAPRSVTPQTSVHDVVHILAEHEFNAVPVVEGERVVGIICQGDPLARAGMPLGVGLGADYDHFEREQRLPVVDEMGSLRGMLSRVDVLGAFSGLPRGWAGPEDEGASASRQTPVDAVAYHDTQVVAPDTPSKCSERSMPAASGWWSWTQTGGWSV